MIGGQKHVMVQLVSNRLEGVTQRDEVNYVVVLVQVRFHVDLDPIVVAVQPLADVAIERDEMGGTENVVFFIQMDFEGF
jgi:hypothetical protein